MTIPFINIEGDSFILYIQKKKESCNIMSLSLGPAQEAM